MSSLRIAHNSRERDRTSSSSAGGGGGITNEAFAQSSVSLYKRISSTENLTSSEQQQHPQSSHQANYHHHHRQSNTSQQPQSHNRISSSTAVLTVPTTGNNNNNNNSGSAGSSSPKGSRGETTGTIANNSSPGSSGSSTTTAYYQHQLHAHPGTSELIAIKSKFEAEFRRFSLQRSDITNLDDFLKTIEHFHKLFTIPFNIFYADPVHGDLLPINNDVNFGLAISSAKPLLRLFVQRKDGSYGYFPSGFSASAKKNFLGTLLPSSSSSNSAKPRLAISAPEDFRQVSSIIDVDIVPDTCRRVRLVKHGSDKPLGFYIRDGTSVRVTAHGVEKVPGIFISRLIPGGLAESTGLLAVNDEVLEVNGIEVNGKSLDQVTDMMVANSSNLIITIRPANQRGHSTLSGSFSSNTISSSSRDGLGHHHGYHSAAQTNSLERGAQRAKKMQAPAPPMADFHNVHHPLHYGAGGNTSSAGMPAGASNHNHHHHHHHQQQQHQHFESLQRTSAHRHSASIIPAGGGGGGGGHLSHHGAHQGHHHHFHHEPSLGYHQFSGNRHSVIGGPGMGEGSHLMTGGSLSGALQGPSVLHHDDDSSDDDDEDEVRDHFTTSLVINTGSAGGEASTSTSNTQSSRPSNGGVHHNTTVIFNSTAANHQPMTISSVSLPVNRTNSSGSTTGGNGGNGGSSKAAAASAANFIRNSLRGKNGPTSAQQQQLQGPSKSFSTTTAGSGGNDARSLYAHLHHHSEAAVCQQAPPAHQSSSRSPSSSPTTTAKARASKPDTSTDDIVTL